MNVEQRDALAGKLAEALVERVRERDGYFPLDMNVLLVDVREMLKRYDHEMRDEGCPVFYGSDGHWYFWDETWSVKHGAYETRERCEAALQEYADNNL